MRSKYIRPGSLTWWVSVAPFIGGVIKAASINAPELAPVVAVIDELSGGASAAVMINAGLFGIGLRGAMG